MKIAIITSRYPSKKDHYAHTFVHRRSKYFTSAGHQVTVYVPSRDNLVYTFDGVEVICKHAKKIASSVERYDIVYFHLLNLYPMSALNGLYVYRKVINKKINCAFYIHGSEVQSMASRNFDFQYNIRQVLRVVYKDIYFMPIMRRIVRRLVDIGALFITPSHWMREEARQQLKLKDLDAHVVPNGIDTDLFSPPEVYANNTKILCIRPLNSNKYAVDLAILTMSHLPSKFTLDVYGKGSKLPLYESMVKDMGLSNRVKFINEFVPNHEMPNVINEYSYYLSPTRMDAQGVSMCEALSCGSVVISSDNTAIPEFVTHGKNGFLGVHPKDFASSILLVHADAALMMRIRLKARESMMKISNPIVLDEELNLLTGEVKCA